MGERTPVPAALAPAAPVSSAGGDVCRRMDGEARGEEWRAEGESGERAPGRCIWGGTIPCGAVAYGERGLCRVCFQPPGWKLVGDAREGGAPLRMGGREVVEGAAEGNEGESCRPGDGERGVVTTSGAPALCSSRTTNGVSF